MTHPSRAARKSSPHRALHDRVKTTVNQDPAGFRPKNLLNPLVLCLAWPSIVGGFLAAADSKEPDIVVYDPGAADGGTYGPADLDIVLGECGEPRMVVVSPVPHVVYCYHESLGEIEAGVPGIAPIPSRHLKPPH